MGMTDIVHSTGDAEATIPKFSFFRNFLDQYNQSVLASDTQVSILNTQDVSAQRMNLLALSKLAGCESQIYRTALSHLMRRIGEVSASGEPVYIDMGIGALKSTKGTITFEFFQQYTPPVEQPQQLMTGTVSMKPRRDASPQKKSVHITNNEVATAKKTNTIIPTLPLVHADVQADLLRDEASLPTLPTGSTIYRRKLPSVGLLTSARLVADDKTSDMIGSTLIHARLPAPSPPGALDVTGILLQSEESKPTSWQPKPTNLPPVLDQFARTQAASFNFFNGYCPPSSRIASYYHADTAFLTITDEGVIKLTVTDKDLQSVGSKPTEANEDQAELQRLYREINLPTALPPGKSDPRNHTMVAQYCKDLLYSSGNALEFVSFHRATQLPLHTLCHYYSILTSPTLSDLRKNQLLNAFVRSATRYSQYITSGMPTSSICPLNSDWIRSALSLQSQQVQPKVTTPLSSEHVTALLAKLVQEVTQEYIIAMKRAILDYILLSEANRMRLSIPQPPPPASHALIWGHNHMANMAPVTWRPRIQQAYLTLNANLHNIGNLPVALLNYAVKYSDLLLFDVPNAEELPISISEMEARHKKHVMRVHKVLGSQWYEECEQVVRAHVTREGLSAPSSGSLFASIATFMSIQLRSIAHRSVAACHAFFMQYALTPLITTEGTRHLANIVHTHWVPSVTPAMPPVGCSMEDLVQYTKKFSICREELAKNRKCNTPRPALLQKLDIRRARDRSMVTLDTSYVDIQRSILSMIDRICSAVQGFPLVELRIFPLLRHSGGTDIPVWVEGQFATAVIQDLRHAVSEGLEKFIFECQQLAGLYEPYERVLDGEADVDAWLAVPRSIEEYRKQVIHFRSTAKTIEHAPKHVRCGLIMVDCFSANAIIAQKAKLLGARICDHVANRVLSECARLSDEFKQARGILLRKPSTAKELHGLLASFNLFVQSQQQSLIDQCYTQRQLLYFLLEFDLGYNIGSEVLSSVGEIINWVKQLKYLVNECEMVCENEKNRLERVLRERRLNVNRAIDQMRIQCNQLKDMFDSRRASEYLGKINSVLSAIERGRVEVNAIKEQEQLLGLQGTEMNQIDECAQAAAPYYDLWSLFSLWQVQEQEWLHGYVFDLDGATLENQMRNMHDNAVGLVAQLHHTRADGVHLSVPTARGQANRKESSVMSVAETLRDSIAAFQPHAMLCRVFCEPSMRDRHWDQVCAVVGSQVRNESDGRVEHITLHRLAEMGVHNKLTELTEICEAAQKEGAVLTLLENMKAEWKDANVRVKAHKDTGCAVFDSDSVEEVQQLLEEQAVKLGRVKGSVFARVYAADVTSWAKWLDATQAAMQSWVTVQAEWIYLEPVFSGGEIAKSLHAEAVKFAQVDSQWRALMRDACIDLNMRAIASLPHLNSILESLSADLVILHHSLQQYLALKRDALPRLYLLSDEHQLSLLGQANAANAASQLQQCFEGVSSLLIEDDVIRSIVSREGEKLGLLVGVDVVDIRGQAERWVGELEVRMRESVLENTNKAIRAYPQQPRSSWMFDWPAQVVLAVNHLLWTQSTTECLLSPNPLQALTALEERATSDLTKVVAMVRKPHSALHSTLLSALLVMDVHNRDITAHLRKTNTTSLSSFEWTSQLRYYWECSSLHVRMVTTSFSYGCEYIGNTPRLVVTNLTDRCYRSLMMAMEVNAGGAPQGPAGTGKTETVKDLSKACGMQCLVFNCSDTLDYKQMGSFFKGISGAGAWVCFDEFNRLQVEVLSVVAQQILSVQLAKEAKATTFWLEGSLVQLRQSANIFITMNPGYAGRTELPDNLKALVRPVAMMVPDYTLIAQVTLFSCGFQLATALANKITKTYKLCSEQLSSQSHYDYGMRAVKAVLSAAETLRKTHPDADEMDLVVTAVVQVNKPKFLQKDIPLFDSIISDLFPGAHVLTAQTELRHQLYQAAQELNLEPEDWLLDKCMELWEMISIRHGVMLVAEAGTGKTAVWRTLHCALNNMAHKKLPHNHYNLDNKNVCECGVEAIVINPKALSLAQLYGGISPLTQEWTDGVLANRFRHLCSAPKGRKGWLMLDGPVDAQWIEDMNTVLDDNKKLCLMSGETIIMSEGMTLIVEVADLSKASPATVSRCGMVLMEEKSTMAISVLRTWLRNLPLCPEAFELVESMLMNVLLPLLKMIRGTKPYNNDKTSCAFSIQVSDLTLISNVLNLFDSLMADEWSKVRNPEEFLLREAERLRQRETDDTKNLSEIQKARRKSLVESIHMGMPSRASSRRGSLAAMPSNVLNLDSDPNLLIKLEGGLLLSMIWGVGGVLQGPSRERFEVALREATLGLEGSVVGLCKGNVWNQAFDVERARWTPWLQLQPSEESVPVALIGVKFAVPTITSVSSQYIALQQLQNRRRAMFVGGSGTGKSLFAAQSVQVLETQHNVRSLKVCVCGATSHSTIQSMIESNIDRKKKGEYVASGGRDLLVFLDDIHMAAQDQYAVQPAAELLRFFIESGSIWDYKEHSLKRISGVRMLASIGTLTGGRSISTRFARQWVPLTLPSVDENTLNTILTTMITTAWKEAPESVANMVTPVVNATKYLYASVVSKLLPTPSRPHYTFTSRDALKIINGLCRSNYTDREGVVRAWLHESLRVVDDRMITESDRSLVCGWLEDSIERKMGVDVHSLLSHLSKEETDVVGRRASTITPSNLQRLYYGNYSESHDYVEIAHPDKLEQVWLQHQENYNAVSKTPLNLVMFEYATVHLSRISRILTTPNAHMVLMGERGCGRQSLTRLASHSVGTEVFFIDGDQHYDMEAWRKDLRSCMMRAGIRKRHVCLFLTESDINRDGVMFDVNTIMNGGAVDRLWGVEEVGEIVESLADDYKRAKKTEEENPSMIMEYFSSRVRDHLHQVCCVSGDVAALRDLLRVYPSLATSTTVDYFDAWPAEALQSIAMLQLAQNTPLLNIGAEQLSKTLVAMHAKVVDYHSASLLADTNQVAKKITVSGGMFLELLKNTKSILTDRVKWYKDEESRYERGVSVIDTSATSIEEMQRELEELQPVLQEMTKDTNAMLERVEKETTIALGIREKVRGEEAVALEQTAAARALEAECEADLAIVLPVLERAVLVLDRLSPQDVAEVKSMRNPVKGVRLVMECLCHMKGIPPARIPDPSGSGKMIQDYWEVSKRKILSDTKLLQSLKQFDKDNIPPKVIKKMKEFLEMEDFNLDKLKSVSLAVHALAQWVDSIEKYNTIWKEVEPKREKLSIVRAECDECEKNVATLREELSRVEENVANLTRTLQDTEEKKAALEDKINVCVIKRERAVALLDGLRGERDRWSGKVDEYQQTQDVLVGRCILAAAQCTYAGWLDSVGREQLTAQWLHLCETENIKCASSPSAILHQLLTDSVTVSEWVEAGLPNDHYSIDNAVISQRAYRWPLIVDPHKQASKWIQSMYSKRSDTDAEVYIGNIRVDKGARFIKYGSADMHSAIEECISQGVCCVLEDVTDMDPALVPLIQKNISTSGNQLILRMGDKEVEYNRNFKLILVCFSITEISKALASSCNVILFELTARAVQEQLLSVVVGVERQKIEQERKRLLLVGVTIGKQLIKVEQDILRVLSTTSGNILDDVEGVTVVKRCKEVAAELNEKKAIIVKAEAQMSRSRDAYRDVSVHAGTLYMSISSLSALDHIYQFGYEWFVSLLMRVLVDTRREACRQRRSSISMAPPLDDEEEDDDAALLDVRERVQTVKTALLQSVYEEGCSGLFSQHRDVFTVLLVVSIGQSNKHISATHWSFLTSPPPSIGKVASNHPAATICGETWEKVHALSQLPGFEKLPDMIAENAEQWTALRYTHNMDPQDDVFDDHGNAQLTAMCGLPQQPGMFAVLANEQHAAFVAAPYELNPLVQTTTMSGAIGAACILSCVRPEKVALFLQQVCDQVLGTHIATMRHAPFSLEQASLHSQPHLPLLMLLSGGSDPMHSFLAYAKDQGVAVKTQVTERDEHSGQTCVSISLGQGQGPIAARAIEDASVNGGWVLLQNCHLALSWLPALATIYNNLASNAATLHPKFRLFLTSYPTPTFPLSIARAAIKCVQQPPQGLRANLAEVLQHHNIKHLLHVTDNAHTIPLRNVESSIPLSVLLRNITILFMVMHCVVKERVEFGPIGMSVPYAFSLSDLDISLKHAVNVLTHQQGQNTLGMNELTTTTIQRQLTKTQVELAVNALQYLVGECNYGGRVTDEWDRRLLASIVQSFISMDSFMYRNVGAVKLCGDTKLPIYLGATEDIQAWASLADSHTMPSSVGLHANATLSRESARSKDLIQSLQVIGRKMHTASSALSQPVSAKVHQMVELCARITALLPNLVTPAEVAQNHPSSYTACLNTVLLHEVERCTSILTAIKRDLTSALACVKGEAVATASIELLIEDLYENRVPADWLFISGASSLNLSEWLQFTAQRTMHLNSWAAHTDLESCVVWFGGLFFPHGFLTAVMQGFARSRQLAIDTVSLQYGYLHKYDSYHSHQYIRECRGLPLSAEAHTVNEASKDAVAGKVLPSGNTSVSEGVVIYGVDFEGACWNETEQLITEMPGGTTRSQAPAMWLKPVMKDVADAHSCFIVDLNQHIIAFETQTSYDCPVYRVASRYGNLLTTGHSTNFIVPLAIPTKEDKTQWIKRGAALVAEPAHM